MIPAEVLRSFLFSDSFFGEILTFCVSGNTTIETSFYDGDLLIAKTLLRLFYV
jgi:hypothetical protein